MSEEKALERMMSSLQIGDSTKQEIWERHWKHHYKTHRLAFTILQPIKIKGENMNLTGSVNQKATGFISGVDTAGNPTAPTFSNVIFTSSDITTFTVAVDPANPVIGVSVSLLAVGSGIISASATATEADGTSNQVTGTASVTVTPGTGPGPTTSLNFTFGPAA